MINSNIIFSLCSFFYCLLILITYFSKKRVVNNETKIYSLLIVVNFIGLLFELLSAFFNIYSTGYDTIEMILLRLINVYFLTWLSIFVFYVFTISYEQKGESDKYPQIYKWFLGIYFILLIIVLILPLHINYVDGHISNTYGPSVSFLYGVSFIYVVACILMLSLNIKRVGSKKYVPLFAFFILGTLVALTQMAWPELLILSSMETFVTVIMFHTIENPDVKMVEQVEIARQQADRANQAKTDFLSNMSHEIRTPLNAIVGFSQALSEEDCLNAQAQDEVKDIMMASENLLEIVNGILDISKIESGKLEIIAKDYSFKKLWDEIVTLGRGRLGDKALDFRTIYDESIPEVLYGDSARIKEVVVNLLTNAIKYTKEGYVELKVSSVIKDDVCRLIISVEDSGIGIKQENIAKLFTKFERIGVEKEMTIEGTGLGLAISKKLVDLMSGTIVVQSIYGKGSKFTVSIDQKIQVGHHLEETQNISLEEMVTTDLSNKRVLVVDDNMVNLKVAARLLKDYNLIIDEVESGMDCISKVMSDVKYDLILMDDMMPKMSGTETLHHLQEIEGFSIPTIALTANAISGMKEKYLGEGFNDYLAKPIDRAELNKIIKKYLV